MTNLKSPINDVVNIVYMACHTSHEPNICGSSTSHSSGRQGYLIISKSTTLFNMFFLEFLKTI